MHFVHVMQINVRYLLCDIISFLFYFFSLKNMNKTKEQKKNEMKERNSIK